MNRDGVALTVTSDSTPANSISRSEPGKGNSRAARKRRSAAANKAAQQLPVVDPRTIASTSSSALRTFPIRRSIINGRIRLLEHRNLAFQAQLRLLRDEFAQYRIDHPSATFRSSVDLGRPGSIHLSFPRRNSAKGAAASCSSRRALHAHFGRPS